jgi:hypothetical protein
MRVSQTMIIKCAESDQCEDMDLTVISKIAAQLDRLLIRIK